MIFSVLLLAAIIYLAYRAAPRESEEDTHVHGVGQIGLLAAVALFGVDYFTSYYYATGELMSSLHPYGMQKYAYIAVGLIALANFTFGGLYMFSLGPFNEGGGSYTASMRYLWPTLSLIVAVTLIQDYVLTIVVSALSGGDQLLSILGLYGHNWLYHFAIGATLAATTWYITIRGRGESARVVATLLFTFLMLTVVMAVGLFIAHYRGVAPMAVTEIPQRVSLAQALMHMLTASMKGMVALTGLEAVSNGIQFMKDEDAGIVRWGKKHLPRLKGLWNLYSGKSGIGRFVQTSFLFYGGLTTLFLTFFAIRFNVFDGTSGRTLVGNLAFIGFQEIPGGLMIFWVYQILAVLMLAAASMTAFQDAQATEWRDVAIGEIPEVIVYRDPRGTFTRSVTITFGLAVLIMLLVRGRTSVAVPFYGVGVFMPITAMALAVRRHIKSHYTGRARRWGVAGATFAGTLSGLVFIGQVVGKWEEGGWVVLVSFSLLALAAHMMLLSPLGYREPKQIHRIVRDKARINGAMASIVEWQSLRMQEYRYNVLITLSRISARFFELFGVRVPMRYIPVPAAAGDYDHALHVDHPDAPSLLAKYLEPPVQGLEAPAEQKAEREMEPDAIRPAEQAQAAEAGAVGENRRKPVETRPEGEVVSGRNGSQPEKMPEPGAEAGAKAEAGAAGENGRKPVETRPESEVMPGWNGSQPGGMPEAGAEAGAEPPGKNGHRSEEEIGEAPDTIFESRS